MTDGKRTMKDVDHTHPHDDRSAGDLFLRGPVVAADGGERGAGSRTSEGERSEPSGSERNATPRSDARSEERKSEPVPGTMGDVDHTPPNGEEGAKRVFERGEEFEVVEE